VETRRGLRVVSAEMVDPAPCVNDLDPICVALTEVIAELFESTGLKRQTVSKVERALVVPRIDTVFRMAAAFGLSFEGFAGEVRQRTQRRQCGRGGRGGN